MMKTTSGVRLRLTSMLAIIALVATGVGASVITAPYAIAETSPIADSSEDTVTADALPTVQIDGVAWDQAIAGPNVWVGGQFANARPAGAAPGTQLTPRGNLLAYNLTSGVLSTSTAPSLNAQVKVVATSPDGSRVYVGGSFNTANGSKRYRLAAYSASTGALITSFAPTINATVNAVVATNTNVYVGGIFSVVGGQTRTRLAAFSASNGALTGWAPTADATVNAMVVSPDGKIIVGGSFQNVNGSPAYGLAALDASSGALLPWNAGNLIRNAGPNAAILSLTTDGKSVLGTGYHFGAGGNLEGTFSADPVSGDIKWVEDCHGDTYDAYSDSTAVYTVSHAHYCGNLGGFFQSDPWSINMRHALAFTTAATGTLGHDPHGYFDYFGTPSPSMINWFPDLEVGTYTGKSQAAWSVTGNGQYVVLGGEFPRVNNVAQQGLVRFAVPSIAPKKIGPDVQGATFNPGIISLPSGAVRIAWKANWDKDDNNLTYKLTRDGEEIYQVDAKSTFWDRPTMGYIDPSSNLTPGRAYKYRLSATDSRGNVSQSETVSFTAPAAGTANAYASRVLADGAAPYWPMNEPSGTVLFDNSTAFDDADAGRQLTRGVPGALSSDPATSFDGSTSASTRTPIAGPNTYTSQVWIKTTTTSGGKILGFGASSTGNSGSYDRHVYMDNSGRIWFGVYPNGVATLNTSASYNDGQWHQITASLGPDGMKLYVDAKLAGQRSDVTVGQAYSGYWRLGGDNLNGWPSRPSSSYFAGVVDEVAIYPTVLSRQTINDQWVASGRSSTVPTAPTDAYGASVFQDDPLLYWRLGESTGTTAADSGPNGAQKGQYENGVTLAAPGGIKGTTNTAASFDGADDVVASVNSYTDPRNYSEEVWFKTTSSGGGKLIGFGNAQDGDSSSYDRHVYMDTAGKVTFGVWTGQANTITAPASLNDGTWHHVVATQSTTDGMKLYIDGLLVGTNPQTGAQSYTGFWRVGGDTHWASGSRYLSATFDEAAIYDSVLSAARVANHFSLGNVGGAQNGAPTAAFQFSATNVDVAFDGSASTDPDGTIATYEWDFGDGKTGTGATISHNYAKAGTYSVTLTVADNAGATNAVTKTVTVTAPPVNAPPKPVFTATANQLTANVDAADSSDPDGQIVSYAWDFGDGFTTTGVTASHAYSTAGSKTITLTVTDNKGATASSSQPLQVVAPPVNVPPVADFTATTAGLTVNFESTSTDSDGTIASYAWDLGDGSTATTATAVHSYDASGTYDVTLTVTDNNGETASKTTKVSVTAAPPANADPVANFTFSAAGLTSTFTSTSTDSDGTISNYAWDFGDSTTDLASTATVQHAYLAAGTYQVTLTVTDNEGATAAVIKPVTVTATTPTTLAKDAFGRTLGSGWGDADTGGAWSVAGGSTYFSVVGGVGKIKLAKAGFGPSATLGSVSASDVSLSVDLALDKAATGGGVFLSAAARKVGNSEYRTTAKILSTGAVQLQLVKIADGVSKTLRTVSVPDVTYAAGDVLKLRFEVSGATTVTLNSKLWKSGTTEPGQWQNTATDSSDTLPGGSVALYPYLSGSATNAPVVTSVDNLVVTAVEP